jgi:hypothetical protein
MRGAWFVLGAVGALAGCDDGIYIEVQSPHGVKLDRVELVMGNRVCSLGDKQCFGVQPPTFSQHLGRDGDVFFRANPEDDYSASVGADGSAYFHLPLGSGTIQILALGTSLADANAGVAAAAVMVEVDLSRGPIRYVTPLLPADVLAPNVPRNPGRAGVKVWRRPSDQIACVGVDDYGSQRGAVFVVPESDPDCDEVPTTKECDPLAYLTTTFKPSPFDARCAANFSVTTAGESACMLGGPACNEVDGTSQACASTNYCVPSAVCGCTAGMFNEACVTESLKTATAPHLFCQYGAELDAAAQHYKPCTNTTLPVTSIDLDAVLGAPCTGLAKLGSVRIDGFNATIELDTGSGHNISLVTEPSAAGALKCPFDLRWSGEVDPAAVDSPQLNNAVVDLSFAGGGTTPPHEVLLPLEIQFTSNCATPPTCTLKGATGDTVFGCAR